MGDGGPPFRIWVPESPLLVLGNSQRPEIELTPAALAALSGPHSPIRNTVDASVDSHAPSAANSISISAESIAPASPQPGLKSATGEASPPPIYKRVTGGGAVLLDSGCVCAAFRFRRPEGWTISDYFTAGNGLIADFLRTEFGIYSQPAGISDLSVGDRKILGSSLHLGRDKAFYLGTFLVALDADALETWLAHPSREPEYRRGRRHADFLTDLRTLTQWAGLTSERAATGLDAFARAAANKPWDDASTR